MPEDFVKLTSETLATLPRKKQEEVYDFARFLKTASRGTAPRRKAPSTTAAKRKNKDSILDLIGIAESGYTDISVNHDKYLYDE